MNGEAEPIVGNWYKRTDKDQTFTVLGLDEVEGIIEIQHLDGEIEEIDSGAWEEMELEPIDEPDEWRGPLGAALGDEDSDEDAGWGDDDAEDERH